MRIFSGGTADYTLLSYDFANGGGVLPAGITFTRASSATYFDSAGILQIAGSGVARVDSHVYSGAVWINRGLQVEESRIKHALWSRDHTNAAWVKSNMTTAKTATGLDGVANSASKLTATAANATSMQTVTIASAQFTTSVYVKRVSGSGNIQITDNNGTNWTTLAGLSSSEWTRHEITRTQANPVFGIRIVTSGDAIEVDFNELEPGEFATSVSETTSSTVTRAAEVVEADITSLDFSRAMTVALDWRGKNGAAVPGRVIDIHHGNESDEIRFQGKSHNMIMNSGSVQQASISGTSLSADTDYRTAFAAAPNDVAFYLDGVQEGVDASAIMPVGMTTINFGSDTTNGRNNNIFMSRFRIWDQRLSNARLVALTT